MRTKNSIKNIAISITTQIIVVLLGFISRKVFVDTLGNEYLGINGVLTSILSMLGLVESGIGVSIVYNLYKPLAEDDTEKVIALVQLYKKIYGVIAIVVFLISCAIYPILGMIIKENEKISYLGVVYFIFVIRNIISYCNAHKWSLINADQKGYVLAKINLIVYIITTLVKIGILKTTNSYILFLLAETSIVIIQTIYNTKIVNKRYPYIKTKEKYTVDKDIRNQMFGNVKALFLHKLGGYCVFGTDSLLITGFAGVATAGIYSNYTMIIQMLSGLITPLLSGVDSSVGNLIATEENDKNYFIFKTMNLINFWIYSLCTVFLYNLLEPFIYWWLGSKYLLDKGLIIIILLNFYINGLRTLVLTFKVKGGIFIQDKFSPLIEGGVNLIASIILVKYMGLAGIFLGTTISTLILPFWNQPRLVYKYIFNKSSLKYFYTYVIYGGITIITIILTASICDYFIEYTGLLGLIGRGLICITITNLIYLLIFYKSKEFNYLLDIIRPLVRNIKNKFKFVSNNA